MIIACAMAAALTAQAAEAAPIKFEFETTTPAGDPFGHGWFVIDDTEFPFPYFVRGIYPNAPDVFRAFHYSDPNGELRKRDVADVHFEIGLFPNLSKWAFNVENPRVTHFLTGSVSGADPAGFINTISFGRLDPLDPYVGTSLSATFPEQVPEPGILLLIGGALGGFGVRLRRLTRQ
jgi:hypothetical protein